MRIRNRMVVAALAATTLTLAACGNSGSSNSGSGSGGSGQAAGKTIKVGVLTSVSGPAGATFSSVEGAVKARFQAYKDSGGKCASTDIQVDMGDDASTPQGALTAAQKLVQQDKVYALMPVSSLFSGASQFAATQAKDTPVVGGSFEGSPQWYDPSVKNFFSANGMVSLQNVVDTFGNYWKSVGGTKAAVVGVNVTSSTQNVSNVVQSAVHAGLAKAYQSNTLALGSTDVGAIVLGIKDSGADVLYMSTTPPTAFAVVAGLKQAGVTMKSVLLPTGYGGDLLASPAGMQAAQGVDFIVQSAPTEANTPATKAESEALQKYAGNKDPHSTFGQQQGWLAADLFLHGLEKAGCDASQSDYIKTLRASNDWNASGLYAHPVDFSKYGTIESTQGPGNCSWIVTVKDNGFVLDPKADPICGKIFSGPGA